MNRFTTEMLQAAKTAKSVEELLTMAKEQNIELTAEEAADYFAHLHAPIGELDDDELDNVAGGGCGTPKKWGFYNGGEVVIPAQGLRSVQCCCEHSCIARNNGINFCGVIWFTEIQCGQKGSDAWEIMCEVCGHRQVAVRGNGDLRNLGARASRR